MSDQPNGDDDQADAFRYELGTSNRENVLASGDRGDDFLRMRHQPRALNQPLRQAGSPENALLAGWKNFHITTTDRDLDAEKQDRLHDGQLFRLNRQARGEIIQQPQRNRYGPNGNMFGPSPAQKNQPALPPILNNPGQNVDPLVLARAMQFKGSYKAGKGRGKGSVPNNRPNNFAPSGPAMHGSYGGRGRGHYSPNSTGKGGAARSVPLNPHGDLHADQGLLSPRGVSRKKKSSAVSAGNNMALPMLGNHNVQPGKDYNAPNATKDNRGHHDTSMQQHMPQKMGGHIAPAMGRTNSSMSSTTMTSSTMASSSSSAIFSTGRRPPPTVMAGKLASPEEFMAAVKGKGLGASKYAPKTQEPKPEDKLAEAEERLLKAEEKLLKMNSQTNGGLSGSKYAA